MLDHSPYIIEVDNTDALPPVRRIRSALVQKWLLNKVAVLLQKPDLDWIKWSAATRKVITSIADHATLRNILNQGNATIIHESSMPQWGLKLLQQEGYQVVVRADSWRDTGSFHIQRKI